MKHIVFMRMSKKNLASWHIVIKHMPDWLKVFDDDKIYIRDAAQIHRW